MPVTIHTVTTTVVTLGKIGRWKDVPLAIARDLDCFLGQVDPVIRPLRLQAQAA